MTSWKRSVLQESWKDQCCWNVLIFFFGDENVSLVEIYSIDKTTTCREFDLTGGPLSQKLFLLKYKHLYLIQVPWASIPEDHATGQLVCPKEILEMPMSMQIYPKLLSRCKHPWIRRKGRIYALAFLLNDLIQTVQVTYLYTLITLQNMERSLFLERKLSNV